MNTPRPEHPRPQFQRDEWMNLNGEWTYRIEGHAPGIKETLIPPAAARGGFADTITVPFAPESRLSGVEHKDFISEMWYHRSFETPAGWNGSRILLHFGAVFYRAAIFIDGEYAGQHVGGSVSFSLDITRFVRPGKTQELVVGVSSNLWDGSQPSGKQSWRYESHGCSYTRTTGIWQTVWLEAVGRCGLDSMQIIPDADTGAFVLIPRFTGGAEGVRWEAVVSLDGTVVAGGSAAATDGVPLSVSIPEPRLWEPGSPTLYDLEFRVHDGSGKVVDVVGSYAGLRKVQIQGETFLLNNRPLYQRLVLDQGFYPDGIWTAPSDEALKHDIELSMAAGFNGARLHQKVFEERYLYWADKLGYVVWAESPSWGLDYCRDGMPHRNFLSEWREAVSRDRNHPSIVAWTPFNETHRFENPRSHQRVHEDAYHICKDLDPTRPVNDASGYIHHITDIYTVHTYVQDPAQLRAQLSIQEDRGVFQNHPGKDSPYDGQPYLVDEFGGIKWDPATQSDPDKAVGQNPSSWGYGQAPQSIEEFYARLEGQVRTLLEMEHIAGWCYTQLTDVEQEQNGIYFYDRSEKFDMKRIRSIFQMER